MIILKLNNNIQSYGNYIVFKNHYPQSIVYLTINILVKRKLVGEIVFQMHPYLKTNII